MTREQALQNFNDLYYFSKVVEYGGFSAASRILEVPKSTLSSRVQSLEQRLGVLLLQRTTRKVQLTEVGARFVEHCRDLVRAAEAAQDVIDLASAGPVGLVRASCPPLALELYLARHLPDFARAHPGVQLQLISTDRAIDLVSEGVDVALRLRREINMDETLVTRALFVGRRILVCSPAYRASVGELDHPDALPGLSTLSLVDWAASQRWELVGPGKQERDIWMKPRLMCSNWAVMERAVLDGLGIALVPEQACQPAIDKGALVRVFPDWTAQNLIVHAVFPTRRGMTPAVRAYIDFLIERLSSPSPR